MQINLVFGPFGLPNLPLGIAGLKSFVEKNSLFLVTCFDFNTEWHRSLVSMLQAEKIGIDFVNFKEEDFIHALDFLKKESEAIFQADRFDHYAQIAVAGLRAVYKTFDQVCRDLLGKKGPPFWFVEECLSRLLDNRPDVVGFSIMFHEQYSFAALIAIEIKKRAPGIRIVFGGSIPSDGCLDVISNSFVDFVVKNEGEEAFLGLLRAFHENAVPDKVPNLVYKVGELIMVTKESVIQDLDRIPVPDFSDLEGNDYFCPVPVVPVLSSRGCYWRKCAFCVHHRSYANTYREASIRHVVDTIARHAENDMHYFCIVDEMVSPVRFRKIAEEILRRDLHVFYYAMAKPTKDFTQDLLRVMYASGCRYILWGLESGCQRVLNAINKGTNVEDISTVLKESAEAGLKNHVFLIVGFPSETLEELQQTFVFLYENKEFIDQIHSGSFSLHRGSPIYEHPEKFGITRIHETPTPSFMPLRYEVANGIDWSMNEKYRSHYGECFFSLFSTFSSTLSQLRNHALYLYVQGEKTTPNKKKELLPHPHSLSAP